MGLTNSWFDDITTQAGLEFVHQVETSGQYLFSEIMAPGVALFDFDNDGRLDVYLIHTLGPKGTSAGKAARIFNQLYHQEADGRFRDVSINSGLDVVGAGNGLAIGDVNNDGWPDVLITEYEGLRLFENRGKGRFVDITAAAGLTNKQWSIAAAFVDFDRDGWLDLVVGNYLDFEPTQRCTDARGQADFCGPHGFRSTITRLWHNAGRHGHGFAESTANAINPPQFVEVTVAAGLAQAPGKAMQVVCADFTDDRWPDIFITDDGLPNRLFVNQRNGTFAEEAVMRGLAYTAMGAPAANMGVAVGDADNDGRFDLFVPHLGEENHSYWRQRQAGIFQDAIASTGLLNGPWHGTGFGAAFGDFDCNGTLDLAVMNGRIRRAAAAGSSPRVENGRAPLAPELPTFWRPYAEPAQLFSNDGQARFADISGGNAAFCGQAAVGRGLAIGDLDNDGGLDLLAIGVASRARLFHNVANRGHWLGIRLIDPALGGRDTYGAEVVVAAAARRYWRLAHPTFSYASSNDPRVHFGLGSAQAIERIEVRWPDGSDETFHGPPVDRYVTLRKGSGRIPLP